MMTMVYNKYAYYLGKVAAMEEMGMEQAPPAEEPVEADPAAAAPEAPEAEGQQFSPEEAQILLQALQMLQQQGMLSGAEEPGVSSDDFVQFAQEDGTEQEADPNAEEIPEQSEDEKGPNWGGKASMEGGDAGNRLMQLGVPGAGAV